jgi:hypothetical protein
MSLIIRDNGGEDFKKVPQGVHIAVCNMIVDCGVQPGGQYKPRHQVYVRWEIPDERIQWTDKDGKGREGPMSIGRFYTASLSEKATLRRDLENWRGKSFTVEELAGFELFNVLGAACQIMVAHNTVGPKTYANITGIMGFPKGQQKPKAENPLIKFSPDDRAQYESLPNWLKEKIQGAVSAPAETSAKAADTEEFDDDIPF